MTEMEEYMRECLRLRRCLERVRDETLEVAAKVCDEQFRVYATCLQGAEAGQSSRCAAAIRALKGK